MSSLRDTGDEGHQLLDATDTDVAKGTSSKVWRMVAAGLAGAAAVALLVAGLSRPDAALLRPATLAAEPAQLRGMSLANSTIRLDDELPKDYELPKIPKTRSMDVDYESMGMKAYTKYLIEHDGLRREYYVFVPPEVTKESPAVGLVFFFHGFTNSVEETCGSGGKGWPSFDVVKSARNHSFIAVCPVGYGPAPEVGWNCEACCGYGWTHKLDDVGFTGKIIAQLKEKVLPDAEIAYPKKNRLSMGFSTGGLFSYRLSCEMSEEFDGVAVMGAEYNSAFGQLGAMKWTEKCPSGGTNVWNGIGTNDFFGLLTGGPVAAAMRADLYAQSVLDCPVDGDEQFEPSKGVSCHIQTKCPHGKRAEFCLYDKMDHEVKGGRTGYGYGTTRVAWSFLANGVVANASKPPPGGFTGADFSLQDVLHDKFGKKDQDEEQLLLREQQEVLAQKQEELAEQQEKLAEQLLA